jgi:hypothetical protein
MAHFSQAITRHILMITSLGGRYSRIGRNRHRQLIRRQDVMSLLEKNPKATLDLLTVRALRLRLNTEPSAELLAEGEAVG